MPDQALFLDQLNDFIQGCPGGIRYCVETRNQNYLNTAYFELLQRLNVSHVFLQGYWMPPVFGVYDRFKDYISNHTVIRLHGPDRSGIEKKAKNRWDRIIAFKDGELQQLNTMVKELIQRRVKVTLSVNNHYEGCAPKTIDRFLDIFRGGQSL